MIDFTRQTLEKLLFEIFADFLRQNNVADDHILQVNLETPENIVLETI